MTTIAIRTAGLSGAGKFWYALGNVALGAAYFGKLPAKKALAEAGLCQLSGAEKFWYVLECVALGAGYFAKLSVVKALSEIQR
jgi:hypothetical protein